MAALLPTREDAYKLLLTYNKEDRTLKHALSVEAVMRYMAQKSGADEDTWGLVGLIHDLDYEQFPEQHCQKTQEILAKLDWPEEIIRAVVSHGFPSCTPIEPQSVLEKTLYAIDELTGLVMATALVRPSRSILDLEAKSVRKKWKEKQFAAGVNREVIERGAAMLNVELNELITDVILGMRAIADQIGLSGIGNT